jgi:hypothetical protein
LRVLVLVEDVEELTDVCLLAVVAADERSAEEPAAGLEMMTSLPLRAIFVPGTEPMPPGSMGVAAPTGVAADSGAGLCPCPCPPWP